MAESLDDIFAGFFNQLSCQKWVTYEHPWPGDPKPPPPPTYKPGERASYDRDALYSNGEELSFEMIRVRRRREEPRLAKLAAAAAATATAVPAAPPPGSCGTVHAQNAAVLAAASTASSSNPGVPAPKPNSVPPLYDASSSSSSNLPNPSPSMPAPNPIPERRKESDEGPDPKRPRPSVPGGSLRPYLDRNPLPPAPGLFAPPPPRFSALSRRSSVRSTTTAGDAEEEDGYDPRIGENTQQLFDSLDPNELFDDSMLLEIDPDPRPLSPPTVIAPALPPPVAPQPPPPAASPQPSTPGECTQASETGGMVGRRVARLFDRTMEEIPDDTSRARTPPPAPPVIAFPRFPPPAIPAHPLPKLPFLPPPPVSPSPATDTHQSALQATESTLFTVQGPPPQPTAPIEIYEDISELTVPLQLTAMSSMSDSRSSLALCFDLEEDEEGDPPPALLAACPRLPSSGHVDVSDPGTYRGWRAAVAEALARHPHFHTHPTPFGPLPALPPYVPSEFARRLRLPTVRPTLTLPDLKAEVLHCLSAPAAPPVYIVRCPNPPPADCRPPICSTEVSDAEVAWRTLSCMRVVAPEDAQWEFYLGTELRSRVPAADRRRFAFPMGDTHVFSDVAFLPIRCNPNPTLAEYFALVVGREPVSEDLCAFWAAEMLHTLQLLVAADVVHGAIGPGTWRIRDFPIEDHLWNSWTPEGAPGWEYKGLELTDFRRGIDLRLFEIPGAVALVGTLPDVPPCSEQRTARPWRHHSDAYGIAECLHQMLLSTPLQVIQMGGGVPPRWRPKQPMKLWYQHDVWSQVFDGLLNLPPTVPVAKLRELRALCEGIIRPQHRASAVKTALKGFRTTVWGAAASAP